MHNTYIPAHCGGPSLNQHPHSHIQNNMVYLPPNMAYTAPQPYYAEPIPGSTYAKMDEFYCNADAPNFPPEMIGNHHRRVYENQNRNIMDTYNYSFQNLYDRNNFIKEKVDDDLHKTS